MPLKTESGDDSPHSQNIIIGLCLAIVLTASQFSGCDRNRAPERVAISGTVTYNGKPLPKGMIRFVPNVNSSAPSSGASVVDGHYKVDGHGGAAVGDYRVQIEASHDDPAGKDGIISRDVISPTKQTGQYLPARYNTRTQLQLTVESGKRELTQNFELTD